MSWQDILKEDFNPAIKNLEKKVYSKYKGKEAMRLSIKDPSHEIVKLFVGVHKRLDDIAGRRGFSPKDQLIDFMTQFLSDEFRNNESAERWLNQQEKLQ